MTKLILASKSQSRQSLLKNAGIPFQVEVSNVDETIIKNDGIKRSLSLNDISLSLAQEKARVVSEKFPAYYVIGADQIMGLENKGFDKPQSMDEAQDRLKLFSEKSHVLHTAVCLFREGKQVWHHIECPKLTMMPLSENVIDTYLSQTSEDILHTVGAYMLEGNGIRLFEKIEGDYFSILGLPLLPLLSILREHKIILY